MTFSSQGITEWFSPPRSPTPRHYNVNSHELVAQLGSPGTAVTAQLLIEAEAGCAEVVSKSESAERRATTIQGSIAIAASLSLAGASLLLDPSKVPNQYWRAGLGAGFAVAVLLFAVAAWRAFLVTWPRYLWASPDPSEIATQRNSEVWEIEVNRVANLLVVLGRNDAIAALQIQLLGQAVRCLLAALSVLALLAVAVAVYAPSRRATSTSSSTAVYVLPPLSGSPPSLLRP